MATAEAGTGEVTVDGAEADTISSMFDETAGLAEVWDTVVRGTGGGADGVEARPTSQATRPSGISSSNPEIETCDTGR